MDMLLRWSVLKTTRIVAQNVNIMRLLGLHAGKVCDDEIKESRTDV